MPDEVKISEENLHRAQVLTDSFAEMVDVSPTRQRDRWTSMEETARNVAGEAPIEDVIDDVGRLAILVSMARASKVEDIPSVYLGGIGMVPNLEASLPMDQPGENVPSWMWDELYYRGFRRLDNRGGRRGRAHSKLTEVLNGFKSGLRLFLGDRLEGYQIWRLHWESIPPIPPNAPVAKPPNQKLVKGPLLGPPPGSVALGGAGFYIELQCTNFHLAAYASPAYALTWRNFG